MGGKTYPPTVSAVCIRCSWGCSVPARWIDSRRAILSRRSTDPAGGSATEFQIYENTASTYLCRASGRDVYTSKGSVIDNLLLQFHNYLDGKAVSTD